MSFECRAVVEPDAIVVHPSGDLDLASISIFHAALANALESGRHIVVDLSDLHYIDSTGLKELLAVEKLGHERGLRLALITPPPSILKIIKIMQLDEVIPVFPALQAALDSWLLRPAGN